MERGWWKTSLAEGAWEGIEVVELEVTWRRHRDVSMIVARAVPHNGLQAERGGEGKGGPKVTSDSFVTTYIGEALGALGVAPRDIACYFTARAR